MICYFARSKQLWPLLFQTISTHIVICQTISNFFVKYKNMLLEQSRTLLQVLSGFYITDRRKICNSRLSWRQKGRNAFKVQYYQFIQERNLQIIASIRLVCRLLHQILIYAQCTVKLYIAHLNSFIGVINFNNLLRMLLKHYFAMIC